MYSNQDINTKSSKSSRLDKKDELKLSTEAKDFQFAMDAVKKASDNRKDKVSAIKSRIESGTYHVDSRKNVEKIFQDTNIDERV